ncbi:MAG: hypothetical protein Fur005_16910 [Roseiflexaceae bacterium]
MSTYFSVFCCRSCKHEVTVGFIGDTNYTVAFCSACTNSFRVAAAPGEQIRRSATPLQLLIFGQQRLELLATRGRTKTITHATWIPSGVTIPVDEELVQIGADLLIDYRLNYAQIACPTCQTIGALIDFREYLQHCPHCQHGMMDEYER